MHKPTIVDDPDNLLALIPPHLDSTLRAIFLTYGQRPFTAACYAHCEGVTVDTARRRLKGYVRANLVTIDRTQVPHRYSFVLNNTNKEHTP